MFLIIKLRNIMISNTIITNYIKDEEIFNHLPSDIENLIVSYILFDIENMIKNPSFVFYTDMSMKQYKYDFEELYKQYLGIFDVSDPVKKKPEIGDVFCRKFHDEKCQRVIIPEPPRKNIIYKVYDKVFKVTKITNSCIFYKELENNRIVMNKNEDCEIKISDYEDEKCLKCHHHNYINVTKSDNTLKEKEYRISKKVWDNEIKVINSPIILTQYNSNVWIDWRRYHILVTKNNCSGMVCGMVGVSQHDEEYIFNMYKCHQTCYD